MLADDCTMHTSLCAVGVGVSVTARCAGMTIKYGHTAATPVASKASLT